MLVGVVGGVMAVYILLLVLLVVQQRKLVFRPDPTQVDLVTFAAPGAMEDITLTAADGAETHSWYLPATRADGRVIAYFHGNAGHRGNRVVRILPYAVEGVGILLVGYRGYGGNAGAPTEEGLYNDGRAALDFLQTQGVKPDQLILFGESLGSAVATQMALERPAAALILEAPFASISRSARARYPFLVYDMLISDKFDTYSKIARVGKPLLLIHGELDRTTPVNFGRMVFDAARDPKVGFFPAGAGHNDLMQHGMPARVLSFIEGLKPVQR